MVRPSVEAPNFDAIVGFTGRVLAVEELAMVTPMVYNAESRNYLKLGTEQSSDALNKDEFNIFIQRGLVTVLTHPLPFDHRLMSSPITLGYVKKPFLQALALLETPRRFERTGNTIYYESVVYDSRTNGYSRITRNIELEDQGTGIFVWPGDLGATEVLFSAWSYEFQTQFGRQFKDYLSITDRVEQARSKKVLKDLALRSAMAATTMAESHVALAKIISLGIEQLEDTTSKELYEQWARKFRWPAFTTKTF